MAFYHDVIVHSGIIDSDYRGTICIKLYNLSDRPYHIKSKDRVAQLIFARTEIPIFKARESLTYTLRGDRAFGSSGK